LDSNVTGDAPDDFGDEPAEDRNPSPDAGRPAAGAQPGVDVTLVAALRPVIREMMDRVRQAQLVLRAFDAAASHPTQARDERSGPRRSKPPEPAAGRIANDEIRVKEPDRSGFRGFGALLHSANEQTLDRAGGGDGGAILPEKKVDP
jgi:hypothetical protein